MVTMFEKLEKSTASASCKIVLVYGPALNSPGYLWSKSTAYMHQRNSCVSIGDKASRFRIKLGVILHISMKRIAEKHVRYSVIQVSCTEITGHGISLSS